MTDLIDRLCTRLGPKGVITDPDLLAPYLVEWRGRFRGATPLLAMPANTEEVCDVVRLCAGAGVAITPQGGNTGLVGGQIPQGEVLLSLKRMDRIRTIDADNDSLIAEAGCVLSSVQQGAAESNRLFPLSLASEGSATIGGLVSTNAGGVHVLRYGMMRDLVLGLEVVLADGRVLQDLKSLRKDNTGYDLKQLFVGAEGTLGIVTAASLKLFPRPTERVVALVGLATVEQALALLHRAKAETGSVSAFEIMSRRSIDMVLKHIPDMPDPLPGSSWLALVEFEALGRPDLRDAVEAVLARSLDSGEASAALIAENSRQMADFWALRENIPAARRGEGAQVSHDVSVPLSRTPEFLAMADAAVERLCPGARVAAFGHMGDGNFHYAVLEPAQAGAAFPSTAISAAVFDAAIALGGSISAEHGIGTARKDELARFETPAALDLMRALKRALDPSGVMNPRVLLP